MQYKKFSALVIIGALIAALSATTAFADYKTKLTLTLSGGSAVSNPTYDETYTLTVPESLRITTTGWNAMDSMTVKYSGSNAGFNTAKKLVVTATSANSFKLVADGVSSTISYFLATAQNDTSGKTSFTFTAAQITAGAEQTLGVNVGTFDGASNGTYTDEITYTVAIQDVSTTTTTTVTWTGSDITTDSDNPFTKDGVTLAADEIDNATVFAPATFTTTLGNFTKIEVTASGLDNLSGDGWSVANGTATWTGTASNSVSFEGSSTGSSITGISTIVFTIAQ